MLYQDRNIRLRPVATEIKSGDQATMDEVNAEVKKLGQDTALLFKNESGQSPQAVVEAAQLNFFKVLWIIGKLSEPVAHFDSLIPT
jgi:hypothetical protein